MLRSAVVLALLASLTACASKGAAPRPFPKAPSPAGVRALPSVPEQERTALLDTALSYRGIPYRNGGSDPTGFDCSGFVQWVFAQHGVRLPRAVEDQYQLGSAIDRDAVVNHEQTLEVTISNSASEPRFRTTLLGSFALAALLLAAIGVYGVIAYSVAQRTQEFGIRMALGAQPSDVLRLVIGKGAALGAAGVVIGLVASLLLTRTLERFLFRVKTTDPLTLVTVAAVLGLVAVLAGYLPARRAVRVDPTIALRYE